MPSVSRCLLRQCALRALLLAWLALAFGCSSHERVPIGRDRSPSAAAPMIEDDACAIPGLDSAELTLLGPSDRSHWLQPWRAYRDTWPAARMLSAPGFQAPFPPDPTWLASFSAARFRHITLEVGWSRQSYDAPETVSAEVRSALSELARQANEAGLRPLLLLDAPGLSGPSREISLALTEPASQGARSVRISPADVDRLEPHKALLPPVDAPALVAEFAPDGVLTLARPLAADLPAGNVQVRLLRYAPFSRPLLADGSPNPEFEQTLEGWLAYLTAVSSALRDELGSQAFDLEIWNETAPGNNYESFDVNALADPPLEPDRSNSFDANLNAIRARTLAWLRAPERGLTQVGISDGSGNMRFSVTQASEPDGVSAISRHVSAQGKLFPEDADLGDTPSLDALGEPNGSVAGETWQEAFTPSYVALFPEQSLTALYPPDARRPPQIVRDLATIPSQDVRGSSHVRAPLHDGVPTPDVWLTAASLNLGLNERLGVELSDEDRLHLQAKALLRSFASYVGAGAGLISIYGPDIETVRYFDLARPDGGAALSALSRFFAHFEASALTAPLRGLELLSVSSCNPEREFEGDGTEAHPPLDHRKLVAFFPFQRGSRDFVVPTYVMTRNLLRRYSDSVGPDRFDASPEPFQLRVRGLTSANARATAYDPLRNTTAPVSILERAGDEIVLAVSLPDYPILLELQD